MYTPSSSRHTRTLSPPLSTSSQAFTAGQQQKLNVVTRLAVEGKAKKDEKGAAIKMYLKISLPLDSVTPGSTIPLFPEENLKILTSQVHPIDSKSVPYNFSSTTSPLLHSAARALNLPARSSKSYLSLFGVSSSSSKTSSSRPDSSSTTSGISAHAQTLDDRYTGHILVSGYNISYILPKEFPPRFNDDIGGSSSMNAFKRRPSVTEKAHLHFMAVIDLWVPFISKPPRAPYLLSIPVPRCLSNNIKLRIFPPTSTAQSFASLSSAEDDPGSWDLTSDPHVTRSSTSRLSRSNSYNHFADDESSDSSTTGFSDGCGIQGTFPSSDRIRVRWAAPSKAADFSPAGAGGGRDDGRRRVGVREVKGEMSCVVVGKGKENLGRQGVMMQVEYKGTCKGVWYAGVATLLGMDVGLEAPGSDVSWVQGLESKWLVSGGPGYTGFDTGPTPKRQASKDVPEVFLSPSSPDGRSSSVMLSRQSSASSTASLLRAPLPAPVNVGEYSFEGSTSSLTGSATMSSISSLPLQTPDTLPSSRASEDETSRPPGVPLTIHVNMNDLLPPTKNVFNFNISGTVLVTPRSRTYGFASSSSSSPISDNDDLEPVSLPRFTVLTADSEAIATSIRNEIGGATVEVFNGSGNLRDAQTRKTVLQKGGLARCGVDGGRIAIRSIVPLVSRIKSEDVHETPNGRTPIPLPRANGYVSRASSSSSLRQAYVANTSMTPQRPRRDGPLMIPSVDITVTPLSFCSQDESVSNLYAVRVCLPAPSDTNSEWLEFGLAQPSPSSASIYDEDDSVRPIVTIASASVEGVPVRFETSAIVKQEHTGLDMDLPFEEMSSKEWISWVRIHVGDSGGGNVQVDYVVREEEVPRRKGKSKSKTINSPFLHVFLPSFQLPVGRLVVNVEANRNLEIASVRSNLSHRQSPLDGLRLLHYSLEELFYPRLSLEIQSTPTVLPDSKKDSVLSQVVQALMWSAPTVLSLVLLLCILSLGSEFRRMQRSLDACSTILGSGWESDIYPETMTVTSTILTSGHAKWWFGDATTSSSEWLDSFATTSSIATHTPAEEWTTSASPTPSAAIPPASTTVPTLTPTHVQTESLPSNLDLYALLPIHRLPFPWPLEIDMMNDARSTADAALRGLRKLWRICMIIYNYPLDPS